MRTCTWTFQKFSPLTRRDDLRTWPGESLSEGPLISCKHTATILTLRSEFYVPLRFLPLSDLRACYTPPHRTSNCFVPCNPNTSESTHPVSSYYMYLLYGQ